MAVSQTTAHQAAGEARISVRHMTPVPNERGAAPCPSVDEGRRTGLHEQRDGLYSSETQRKESMINSQKKLENLVRKDCWDALAG